MLALYIFSLVLGGGFLAVSLIGDVFGDAEIDIDVDGELDLSGDASGGHDTHATKIFSFRTVVYALFGVGAVGTPLTLLGSGDAVVLASAVAGGLASAALIHASFRYLERTDSGSHPGDASFVGLPGTVTLPLSPGVPGTVAIERGGRRIALRALPHSTEDGDDVSGWSRVVVVDMTDGVARVSPVEEDLGIET